MVKDLTDSIKAKLYDFAYTPFMSSFVISWIFLNHKYLLIYFGNEKLETKIRLLSMYSDKTVNIFGINICSHQLYYPVLIALGYVFIYPLFSMGFYAVTLGYKNLTTKIKQKFEKKVLIDKEIENELRITIDKLQKESDDYRKDRIEMRDKYDMLDKNLSSEIQKKDEELSEKNKKLEQTTITQPNDLKIINSQSEKINNLNKEIEKLKKENESMKNHRLINATDIAANKVTENEKLKIINSQSEIINKLKKENEKFKNKILEEATNNETERNKEIRNKQIWDEMKATGIQDSQEAYEVAIESLGLYDKSKEETFKKVLLDIGLFDKSKQETLRKIALDLGIDNKSKEETIRKITLDLGIDDKSKEEMLRKWHLI